MKKLTQEDFVKKSIEKHGNEYDYSKSIYINKRTKVEIICPIHGSFFQTPYEHKKGSGCPKCSKTCELTTEEFVKRVKEVHGNKS